MDNKTKAKFHDWYESWGDVTFFEIVKFSQIRDVGGTVFPFYDHFILTIAGLAINVFKSNFLMMEVLYMQLKWYVRMFE